MTVYAPLLDTSLVYWLIIAGFAGALLFHALLPLFISTTASSERDAPDRPTEPPRREHTS